MSYLKYDGSVAAETPAPTVWLSGSNPLAETLTGTAVANALDGYDGDMLRGGAGDDTYYLKGPGISIVEAASAGADKIVAWMNVDLTDFANVENLEIGGDRTYGAGNALDNLIVASGSSSYQLYGLTPSITSISARTSCGSAPATRPSPTCSRT
jgi:serralysin